MLNIHCFLLLLLIITLLCLICGQEQISRKPDEDDKDERDDFDVMGKSYFLYRFPSRSESAMSLQKKLNMLTNPESMFDDTDRDEVLPKLKIVEEEELPEMIEAKHLLTKAKKLLSLTKPDEKQAYFLLEKAADLGNLDAKAEIAWAELFGKGLPQNITNAAKMFEFLANKGHSDGHMGMGFLHATGIAVPLSQAKAILYYSLASAAGHRLAKYALANRYNFGINIKKSCDAAMEIYLNISSDVISRVSFSGGVVIHKIRFLDEYESDVTAVTPDHNLLSYYELMAEKGEISAQIILGQMYYQGAVNIQVDYAKAKYYFDLAANAKNTVGMTYLGKLYLLDNDVIQQDYLKALYYFQMAADENNPVALTGLGYMYLYGLGVEVNYAAAIKHFMAAVKDKYVEAHFYIGLIYFEGLGVERNYEHAFYHFQNAALSGSILSFFYLGKMYAAGLNVFRSCSKAVEFLKNVAERDRHGIALTQAYQELKNGNFDKAYIQYALYSELGYEVAQSNVAFMLRYHTIPLLSNYNKSEINQLQLMYWSRAANQGYSLARLQVGDCYYYGSGTGVDYEIAAAMYRIAAEQLHNSQAMFNLGYMHEHGIGMERDVHLAKRYYDQAIEFNSEAKVPCYLALTKLYIVTFLERFYINPIQWFFYLTDGVNIYVTLAMGLVVIYLEIYYGHLLW